tara:strand:- start:20900 stop:21580 length:681 start_codon:yes stop_codon:yes gene_type:complete
MSLRFFAKLKKSLIKRYRIYVLGDNFYRDVKRWFADNEQSDMRYDNDLDANSIVFDVGGFQGDFADEISKRYNCAIYIFEPVAEYYEACVARFSGNDKIKCFHFGLGGSEATFTVSVAGDASSTERGDKSKPSENIRIRPLADVMMELGVENISLIKMNIEGGEYDLMTHVLDRGIVDRVEQFLIQFHNFVPKAIQQRNRIRDALGRTHQCLWCYEFVWEKWVRRS